MDPGGQRSEVPQNPSRIPPPPGSQLRQNAQRTQRQTHQLGFLPPVLGKENLGGKPGSIRFHVIPGCLLEPKPQDVQPGPWRCEKLHMGGEGHQRRSKGQMGHPRSPDHQGKARDHQSPDPVRSPPNKAPC